MQTSPVAQTVKASAYNAGDPGSIPGSGRSSGEGNGSPLQCSCLENPMGGGAWWATVHGVTKSRTRLSDFTNLTLTGKKSDCQGRTHKRCRFDPWVGKISWRRTWQPTPVFMPGKSHGERRLEGKLQSMGSQRVGQDGSAEHIS